MTAPNCIAVNTRLYNRDGLCLGPAEIRFDEDCPFAATLVLGTESDPNDWVIARDLLHNGLGAPSGLGDITVAPFNTHYVSVTLSSPHGRGTFYISRGDVEFFLAQTGPLVPEETDDPDLDVELLLLLGGAS